MAIRGGRPRSIVRDPDTGDVVNGLSRRKKTGVFYATGASPYKSFGDDLKSAIRRFRAWQQPESPAIARLVVARSPDAPPGGFFESLDTFEATPTHLQPLVLDSDLFRDSFLAFLRDTGLDATLGQPTKYEPIERCPCALCIHVDRETYDTDAIPQVYQAAVDPEATEEWHTRTWTIQEGHKRYWAEYHDWVIGEWIKAYPKDAARRLDYPELENLEAIKPKPQSITLVAIADLFENKPVGNREYRRRFAKRFREFAKIVGVKTVKEIEPDHIEKYYARVLKDSKQGDHGRPYAKSRFDVVTAVLTYAHKRGRDQEEIRRVLDRCQILEAPRNGIRPNGEARPVTREELHAVLALADVRQTAIIMLGINAGFDPVDIQRLPLDAVDLKTRVLHFDRTKADAEKPTPRIATLWPRTVKALRKYLKDCPHEAANDRGERMFFATTTGKAIRQGRTWISRAIWRPLRVAAGQPEECKFKGLRKAAYTEASQISPRQADILLGHRLPGVTDNYLRRNPQTVAPACRAIEKHYFG